MPKVFPKYGSKSKNVWIPKINEDNIFLELSFEQAVFITKISIYETFNPGSISKIFSWKEESQDFHQIYEKSKINELDKDILQESRIFQPPLKTPTFKTNLIRIEFLTNGKLIEIDSINIQGIIEKSNLNRFSMHSEFIDTIEQQKFTTHIPYANPILSPWDFNKKNNCIIFNEIESQKYHVINQKKN